MSQQQAARRQPAAQSRPVVGRRRAKESATVRVDPIQCVGIGMCAHLAPGVVALDTWGFPVLPRTPLSGRELAAARTAASACPRRALFLEGSPRS